MKTTTTLAALMLLWGGAALADPVYGVWRTAPDDNGNSGHIRVQDCGDAICGRLIQSFDAQGAPMDSPNTGKRIIWGMKAKGGGEYGGGKIWSPDRDKTYNSKMTLNGDTLSVEGCVLFICRDGGTWTRVE
ncbi:MAG: DUF2147 domain-containing protein [Sediminimonas qiaohouensis]|uniref:DUF2147 domain-containing protein n=1 Tax=Sediminimonas qiaohouensis TaxID=552061 RepID=A0A7C9LAC4_9RHOB|nr:DUF2147 domain-containing protein [Sediminimonas qiaohouensis]MTJ04077.1 DUF2147 domain-containing protein [Sediminimonas qiaohouensis]